MDNRISISQIKKRLRSSSFFVECRIPMGYTAGFPIFQIRNDSLCLLLPYMKYQTTGEVDKTKVFPIRYTFLLELPTEKVIGFENLEYAPAFKKVDFDSFVGYFRHKGIQQYSKSQYSELYDELMGQYDRVANALIYGEQYSAKDERRMSELLQLLMEPSLLPMYRALDEDFYEKYLA